MATAPLYTLGPIVFRPGAVHLDGHEVADEWSHRYHPAIEGRGRRGFHGRQNQRRSFSGVVFPRQYGAEDAPLRLREMANLGQSWQLIDGAGNIVGRFVVISLTVTHSTLLPDGTGRRMTYRLELREDPSSKQLADRVRDELPTDRLTPATDLV